jgi:hypothetical protein
MNDSEEVHRAMLGCFPLAGLLCGVLVAARRLEATWEGIGLGALAGLAAGLLVIGVIRLVMRALD